MAMMMTSFANLPLNVELPLFARLAGRSASPVWRRVGTIVRVAGKVRVAFDPCCACLLPLWDRCAQGGRGSIGGDVCVCFGVLQARRGVVAMSEQLRADVG